MNNTKKDWSKWIYWFLLGIALILVYKGLDNYDSVMNGIKGLMNVLSPFIVGIFIAYLLYMPARKFEEWFNKVKIKFIRKRSRALSVITVYLIILAIIIVLFSCIMPIVFGSIADFLNNLQGYITNAVENYNKLPEDSFFKGQIVQDVIHSLQNINIKQYFNVEQIVGYVTNAISAVFSVIDIFIAIIVSIYILTDNSIFEKINRCYIQGKYI